MSEPMDVAPDLPPLLTAGEVAALLGVTESAVRGHVREGSLRAFRLGDGPKARIRIESSAVAEFLRESRAASLEAR